MHHCSVLVLFWLLWYRLLLSPCWIPENTVNLTKINQKFQLYLLHSNKCAEPSFDFSLRFPEDIQKETRSNIEQADVQPGSKYSKLFFKCSFTWAIHWLSVFLSIILLLDMRVWSDPFSANRARWYGFDDFWVHITQAALSSDSSPA